MLCGSFLEGELLLLNWLGHAERFLVVAGLPLNWAWGLHHISLLDGRLWLDWLPGDALLGSKTLLLDLSDLLLIKVLELIIVEDSLLLGLLEQ